jgi:hypothetical protein
MGIPFGFWDISLWLAVVSIILLATAELISPYYGHLNLLIDRRRLRRVALVMGMLFLVTVALRIINLIS